MGTSIACVPQALVSYVECENGHRLSGLFILFRPAIQDGVGPMVKELLGRAERRFTLALVDSSGFIRLVPDGVDPWQTWYTCSSPHALNVIRDHPYEFYLIRHPNVDLARLARAELNGEMPREFTAGWKFVKRKFERHAVQVLPEETFEELVLRLPESPDSYYPKGGSRYGDWVLYSDMPHGDCELVKQAVFQLQKDLGALRYVVGSNPPYYPDQENIAKFDFQDGRTLNAVYVFQQDAIAGRAYQVENRDATVGKAGTSENPDTSLKYLEGGLLSVAPEELTADGVVDAATAAAIEKRHAKGLCSPHALLVCIHARDFGKPWYDWLRVEAAAAFHTWREIAKALGCDLGVCAGHTYRSVMTDVGSAAYGRSKVSIHKTGLAIDIAMRGYQYATDFWPVLYSRETPVPACERNKLVGHRVKFRLYADGRIPVGSPEGLEACKQNLEALKAKPHKFSPAVIEGVDRVLENLKEPAKFLNRYFREKVKPWQYDHWHDEGGTEGPAVSPPEYYGPRIQKLEEELKTLKPQLQKLRTEADAIEAQTPHDRAWRTLRTNKLKELGPVSKSVTAKEQELARLRSVVRFLDLTAIAEDAGIERIFSFTNKDAPGANDWGLAGYSVNVANLNKLATQLQKLEPKLGHVKVATSSGDYRIDGIDANFMAQWAAGLKKAAACKIATPEISCLVSPHEKGGKKRVQQIRDLLTKFGERQFVRSENDVKNTGSFFLAEIDSREKELAERPVKKQDDGQGSTHHTPQDNTWTLRPIFTKNGDTPDLLLKPKSDVRLPLPGKPIGMEWWHYQHQDSVRGKRFGELLCDLGWTPETAGMDQIPHLYYRFGVGYPPDDLKIVVARA